jgi:hypothetical protein
LRNRPFSRTPFERPRINGEFSSTPIFLSPSASFAAEPARAHPKRPEPNDRVKDPGDILSKENTRVRLIIQERKHSVSTNKEIDAESGSKTRAKKIDPTPECPEILNYLSLTPDP